MSSFSPAASPGPGALSRGRRGTVPRGPRRVRSDGPSAPAELARPEMISVIAHELRTPITSISGFAKLLMTERCGPLTEEQRQFCQIIHRNAGTMERLISDLLDMSKLEQGVLEMRLEELSLGTLLQDAVQMLQAGLPEAERRVRLALPGTSTQVRGDRMRLLQVLSNLLSNAHKYSPAGSPIEVSLVPEPDSALVTVRNLGPALSPAELEQVFEKFYRVRGVAPQHVAGSGLGLAIARRIILAHGGTLWAENAAGGGTAFKFRLPFRRPRTPASSF